MIISHRHKFIFIHNRKAAGSSISTMLCPHLGPSDIMVGAWVDAISHGCWPNAQALQSLLLPRNAMRIARFARHRNFGMLINSCQKGRYLSMFGPSPGHATAQQIRAAFPDEWGAYFKFCFVRNPYDQVVSAWKFAQATRGFRGEFSEYVVALRDGERRTLPENWPGYTIDGKVAVDFVGRFENLTEDLGHVLSSLGLDTPVELPRAKESRDRRIYREFYTKFERSIVRDIFAPEIERFGYSF